MKILFLSLLFFLTAGYLTQQTIMPKISISKQDSALNINHKVLKVFTLGQNRLIADFMWISTLLESDLSHYKHKDLNSWMFLRFNSIAEIDPLFLRNYQFGGQYLSIIKDDLIGAQIIFDKGLKIFKYDFDLNFNAGFLQAFELKNYKKAVDYYQVLIDTNQAPIYLASLINKLKYASTPDIELTYSLVLATYKKTEDGYLKEKLKNDLYSLKATIDLKCINSHKKQCSFKDFDGIPYIKKGNKYVAPKKFTPYKLYL